MLEGIGKDHSQKRASLCLKLSVEVERIATIVLALVWCGVTLCVGGTSILKPDAEHYLRLE